jgi:Rha family phage regulatory protein
MKDLSTETPFIRQKGGQLFTTSIDVAEKFEKQHKIVLRAIRKLECSSDFSRCNFVPSKYTDDRGKTQPMFYMTKDGFTFLVMGFTGKNASEWKEKYIHAFNSMEQALTNQKNLSWKDQREQGKIPRKEVTNTIQRFVSYAESQGSTHATRYYPTITKAVYKCLFIIEDRYGKSFRDLLNTMQLQFLGVAEYVAAQAIEDGMAQKLPYKEIYQFTKAAVEKYAESVRRTKVVSRQLHLIA